MVLITTLERELRHSALLPLIAFKCTGSYKTFYLLSCQISGLSFVYRGCHAALLGHSLPDGLTRGLSVTEDEFYSGCAQLFSASGTFHFPAMLPCPPHPTFGTRTHSFLGDLLTASEDGRW